MAISADVKSQLFRQSSSSEGEKLIRLPHESDAGAAAAAASPANASNGKAWTREEHERFLEGLELFPSGPWKEVAAYVGTRTTRQTMTHAQKYREKIARRKRGLRGSAGAHQRAAAAAAASAPVVTTASPSTPQQQPPQKQKQQHSEMVIAANAATTLSFQQQLKQAQASPTSVVLPSEHLLEDPLDFGGCFLELDPEQLALGGSAAFDFALDQTLLVALAASEGDHSYELEQQQQLSLSDEEMDLIMHSVVATSAPSAPSATASVAGARSVFSFVC